MIKIHTSHVDLLEQRAREISACNCMPQEEIRALQAKSVAHLEAQLMVCFDEEARAARVAILKAQVDSESYYTDSAVLAQKIQGLFIAHATPEAEVDALAHLDADE